jgi:hypothetical protein
MDREDFTDAVFGTNKYRISRLGAMDGSWILAQIFTKVLPSGMESGLVGATAMPGNRSDMSENEFRNIQTHCLRVCARHGTLGDSPTLEPVLRNDGRFSFPDLEKDLPTVLGLTVSSLMFSLSPFFEEGVLKQTFGALQPILEKVFGTPTAV